MKRKLLGIVAILGFGLALSACSNTPAPVEQGASDGSDAGEPENNGEPATKTGSYTIKVYDIDDEVLGEKTVSIEDYPVFIDGLNANFDAVLGSSSYGSYPISINGSVVDDPNWYMASYENGEYCLTSLEGLVVDDGDLFEFKVTCSNEVGNGYDGTMDSYDVLVDKTIYHYAKTYMKAALESSSSSSYTGSKYWEDMIIYQMLLNGYDYNVFGSVHHTREFMDSVSNADVSTLSGNNVFKWFYAARILGLNLDSYKTKYKAVLESTTTFNAFSTSFLIGPAKYFELESSINSSVINTESKGSGDGLCWALTGLSMYKTFDNSELDALPIADTGNKNNATNLALRLLPYAAFNVNVRTKKNTDNKDILELLFDNYYDSDLMLVKYREADTADNMSTNQIYASLVAYKLQRDKKKAVSIFA